jgi:hypothetical protein
MLWVVGDRNEIRRSLAKIAISDVGGQNCKFFKKFIEFDHLCSLDYTNISLLFSFLIAYLSLFLMYEGCLISRLLKYFQKIEAFFIKMKMILSGIFWDFHMNKDEDSGFNFLWQQCSLNRDC